MAKSIIVGGYYEGSYTENREERFHLPIPQKVTFVKSDSPLVFSDDIKYETYYRRELATLVGRGIYKRFIYVHISMIHLPLEALELELSRVLIQKYVRDQEGENIIV